MSSLGSRIAATLGRAGLLRNSAALGYGQVVRLGTQIASVPVFTYYWGLHDYGTWLLLFTLPGVLVMGDLGFNFVASNAMIAASEGGNQRKAAEIFGALRTAVLTVAAVIFALIAATLALRPALVDFAQAGSGGRALATVLALVAYGLIGLQNASTLGGFRSTGDYARGVLLFETTNVCETLTALAVVALGGNLAHVALAYLLVRASWSVFAAMRLRRHAPMLFANEGRGPILPVLRKLARPAMAVTAVPIANALSIQGTVAILGAMAGPAVVPVFTTTRTLTRFIFQLTTIFSLASMPLFTSAAARGETARMERLVNITLTAGALILLPALLLLGLAGSWIVELWTNGLVRPGLPLLLLLEVSVLLSCAWMLISNFILSLNRQSTYSYYFLAGTLVTLASLVPLTGTLGPLGAAIGVVLLDLAMAIWVFRAGARLGIIHSDTFRNLASLDRLKAATSLVKGKLGRQ